MFGGETLMKSYPNDFSMLTGYLAFIDRYVVEDLKRIQHQSCFATILMVFASADGLGGLTHPEVEAGNKKRFTYYIEEFFPIPYRGNMKMLWDLRNALAHNALNVAAFVSYAPASEQFHLTASHTGDVLVYAPHLVRDFRQSLETLKQRLATDLTLAERAEGRLTTQDVHQSDFYQIETTPPPPVKMIRQRYDFPQKLDLRERQGPQD